MLKAVVFDVDGTLAETERHGHRVAFNRAFKGAGLLDRWDEELYGELLRVAGGRERILHYFKERSTEALGDPETLAVELHKAKVAEFKNVLRSGGLQPRPGIHRLLDELDGAGVTLAVATTGTRSAILDLLTCLRLDERFDVILTADEAPVKKPAPEVYEMALAELGVSPGEALAVEDSRNGLIAAKAAGMPCLVTVSEYNVAESFGEADLVVDGLGEPDAPATVLSDPHGVVSSALVLVDVQVLMALVNRATAGRR